MGVDHGLSKPGRTFLLYKCIECLTLSLMGVGPFGHTPLKWQNTLKVLKARYLQKLGIPQVVS